MKKRKDCIQVEPRLGAEDTARVYRILDAHRMSTFRNGDTVVLGRGFWLERGAEFAKVVYRPAIGEELVSYVMRLPEGVLTYPSGYAVLSAGGDFRCPQVDTGYYGGTPCRTVAEAAEAYAAGFMRGRIDSCKFEMRHLAAHQDLLDRLYADGRVER